MDSRRLVVWISTGILGFQGATLAFDLLNCTALSWLYVRMNGLPALERRAAAPDGRSGLLDPYAANPPTNASTSEHPVALFCARPQGRIDDAVNQGLSILAGLALGSSVNGRGPGQP
ncbi:hypothetical protein CB0101_11985 [Synechococcus sp. CB0101]|uniref:hypothetical protein n=1 Tax=Synechococcus sp. CB0101 TaxID=232348 RepID=UPI00020010A8|nr:hypothetical protein [Synechococcus sp. CB0101]QCH15542.1 hypothetical protein CB0101_11985 [Synechococcus sp. CB0101]